MSRLQEALSIPLASKKKADNKEGIQEAHNVKSTAKTAPARERRDDDDDDVPQVKKKKKEETKKKKGMPIFLILGGVAALFLLLLLAVGGVAGYFIWKAKTPPPIRSTSWPRTTISRLPSPLCNRGPRRPLFLR